MKKLLLFSLLFPIWSFAQDSLGIRYSIVQMEFQGDRDIIKIKAPAWLKTSELMDQIRHVIFWPGEPPPSKRTFIYVFKETDPIGAVSKTGCVYIPGHGFHWDLRGWEPGAQSLEKPTEEELTIYYEFVDAILEKGSTLNNVGTRGQISQKYDISPTRLDSIYVHVKYWLEKNSTVNMGQNNLNQTTKSTSDSLKKPDHREN